MGNKLSFSKLKLKSNNEVNTFNFNDNEVEVLKYLPAQDKYDLIMITLQKAQEDGIFNEFKLDVYFHLHMIYMYTNLTFTDSQKEDEFKLYDLLAGNGFIDKFIDEGVEESEYAILWDMLMNVRQDITRNNTTIAGVIRKLVDDLPKSAEAAAKIVEEFDPEKYKRVKDFADAIK